MAKTTFIGNHIKPKRLPTRTEIIHGVAYVFADLNKDGHFIAEVKNPAHAKLMLAQPRHFYAYNPGKAAGTGESPAAPAGGVTFHRTQQDPGAASTPEPENGTQQPEAAQGDASEAVTDGQGSESSDADKAPDAATEAAKATIANAKPEHIEEAKKLLAHPQGKVAVEMQKLSGAEAIGVALALEQTADKPRPTVVRVLSDALQLMGAPKA